MKVIANREIYFYEMLLLSSISPLPLACDASRTTRLPQMRHNPVFLAMALLACLPFLTYQLLLRYVIFAIITDYLYQYGIDHCVAGYMTRYLPRERLSPAEA